MAVLHKKSFMVGDLSYLDVCWQEESKNFKKSDDVFYEWPVRLRKTIIIIFCKKKRMGASIKDVHSFLAIFDPPPPLSTKYTFDEPPLKKTYTFDWPYPPPWIQKIENSIFACSHVRSRFFPSIFCNICTLFLRTKKFYAHASSKMCTYTIRKKPLPPCTLFVHFWQTPPPPWRVYVFYGCPQTCSADKYRVTMVFYLAPFL